MRSCGVLVLTVAILSSAGLTLGYEDGDVWNTLTRADTGSSVCPLSEVFEQKPLIDVYIDKLRKCFLYADDLVIEILNETDSQRRLKDFFREYCQNPEVVKRCLSRSLAHASSCLNEFERNDLFFVVDNFKKVLKLICVNDGEFIASVLPVIFTNDNKTSLQNGLSKCMDPAIAARDANSITSKRMGIYQEFDIFRQCLIRKLHGDNQAVFKAQCLLNEILWNMELLAPSCYMTGMCAHFDDSFECPFVETTLKMYTDFGLQCFTANTNNVDFTNRDNFISIEDFRSFFKSYCSNKFSIIRCLEDVSKYLSRCETETYIEIFRQFNNLLQDLLEKGCEDEGLVFATVVNGIMNGCEMESRRVKICTDDAVDRYNNAFSSSLPSNNAASVSGVRVYQSVEAIKNCILNNTSGDGIFKSAVKSISNDIFYNKYRCYESDEGRTPCPLVETRARQYLPYSPLDDDPPACFWT